jgi:hypothetical protein
MNNHNLVPRLLRYSKPSMLKLFTSATMLKL